MNFSGLSYPAWGPSDSQNPKAGESCSIESVVEGKQSVSFLKSMGADQEVSKNAAGAELRCFLRRAA